MERIIFTRKEEERLINLVQENPALYSTNHDDYKNATLKATIWRSISDSMKRSEKDCKTKWKYIRDYYMKRKRENRLPTEAGSRKDSSNIHRLSFLNDSLEKNPNQAADHPIKEEYNTTDDSAAIDEDDYAYDRGSAMDDDESCCYPDANGEGATSGRTPGDMVECLVVIEEPDASKYGPESSRSLGDDEKPRKKRRREDSLETRVTGSSDVPLEAHSTLLPEKPERWRRGRTEEEELEDADLSFFKSLFPDLKKMTPRQKNRFKASVLNCIDDILFKDAKDEISES